MNKTTEALKMAIDLLESLKTGKENPTQSNIHIVCNMCEEALATNEESLLVHPTIKESLNVEQPAQEPVAWISVKDRLPSTTQQIEVVFFANPYEWRTGLFTPKGFLREYENNVFQYHQHWGDDKYHTVDNVTYWMPLPEVPKEAV